MSTAQDQKKRALEALERRIAVAKAEVQHQQLREKRKCHGQSQGSNSYASPSLEASPARMQSTSLKKDSEADGLTYSQITQPVHEKLLTVVEASNNEKGTVDEILRELLLKGDASQKYIQGSKSIKVDHCILLDNFIQGQSTAATLLRALKGNSKRSKRHMSMKQLKKCGALYVPEEACKFETFMPMHEMWKEYVMQLLKNVGKNQVAPCLLAADLHGAILRVIECKINAFIGVVGIMIRETAETFGIITEGNIFRVLNVSSADNTPAPIVKKLILHPPSASRILLPDGRHIAYHEQGVPADRARFTLIAPHPFLSSRLAGIPGIKASLLEEFGVRLVTYDLPGFGESDPHPSRDLNSSAIDMQHLEDSIGANDKFWMLGYSSAAMHAWVALRYVPNRVAGAAFVAPLVNPYERSMTKEEMGKTWERWEQRRKYMFSVARKFPGFLSSFYRRSFFSGKHGQIEKWFSLTLSEKDRDVIESASFEEFWQRDVEESVRQGNMKPFIHVAKLQVSDWGFSLADFQRRRRCSGKGLLPWLKSLYSHPECELTGFTGPIHIWQGLKDHVVPPPMSQYISRVLPTASLHQLRNHGHFSYFFCDECHKEIVSTLFGDPLGPLDTNTDDTTEQSLLNTLEEEASTADTAQE